MIFAFIYIKQTNMVQINSQLSYKKHTTFKTNEGVSKQKGL